MQHGSMIRTERHQGPDVWEFRWREPGPDGKRKHRRIVVGSIDDFVDELTARQAIAGLQLDMNARDARVALRERTLVLLDFGTGLRMSELFALKWRDINFLTNEISVTRSIVFQVVGPCKTEASQKPIPLDPYFAEALLTWRQHTRYRAPDDWVFASPATRGRQPYWGQSLMRRFIRPAAAKVGITQHIGWHTFRRTYSSLLRATRADIKVMQELLRHASSRVTLDTYTQAVTPRKRKAQSA